jgi:hypothetical protein
VIGSYALGVLLQILGSLGWGGCVHKLMKRRQNIGYSFAIAAILESGLLSVLAMGRLMPSSSMSFWFWAKCILGIWMIISYRWHMLKWLRENPWIAVFGSLLALHACCPSSNFDCFSAHFPIPKLFIETEGYPLRPDFQYLDALPLAAHMWMIPPFAAGFEGGVNIISSVFAVAIFVFIAQSWGHRLGFLSLMVCLSMPEFIRVSLDPMVDTPCFFFALVGMSAFRQHGRRPTLGFACWAFLVGIKPTLAPLAIIGCIIFIRHNPWKKNLKALPWLFAISLPASIWYLKNTWLHGSPLYPYFGTASIAPLIPAEVLQSMPSETILWRFWNYLTICFAEQRYALSFGFWPLFCVPFFIKTLGRQRLISLCLIMGFAITLAFTPFKNRYFMPYLFLLLPFMALLARDVSNTVRYLLYGIVFINSISVAPYLMQPLYAAAKAWDRDDFYRFKFYNYGAYERLKELPPGKILLVGQASHWIDRPHQLSVISETHLDFTRMSSVDQLLDFLSEQQLKFVVFDWRDVNGMAENNNPWYRKKAHCAQRALHWMQQLQQHPSISMVYEENGVRVLERTGP